MMLPPEKPATWAEEMSSARSTPPASSAIVSTDTGPSGIGVRPALDDHGSVGDVVSATASAATRAKRAASAMSSPLMPRGAAPLPPLPRLV